MTFLTPLLAGIAAAIAVPALIILYFLKLKRRDLEVSTTLLWKKAIEDLQANAPFQRLRRNILLFLQLLALAAALFALAQPELKAKAAPGGRHVILLDRSASMEATDGDPKQPGKVSRLDAAKKEALALVDTLREPGLFGEEGDQAMVIAFDVAAEVRQNFTASKAALKTAIESLTPTDSSTSIKEAIKLAKAYSPREIVENKGLQASGPPARIHIFSDGRLPDALSSGDSPSDARIELTPEDDVVYHSIGSPDSWNIGITGIRAERAFDQPSKLSVFVGLQSTAREPKTVDVELSLEGRRVGIREAKLVAAQMRLPDGTTAAPKPAPPPGSEPPAPTDAKTPEAVLVPATGGIVFTLDNVDGGIIVAKLSGQEPDALPVDDLGYLSVPPAKRLSLALVSTGNLFLREIFEGLTLSKFSVFTPAEAQAVLDDPRRSGEYDVFVLDRWLPTVKPPPGSAAKPGPGLPTGRFLVFGAIPPPPLGLKDLGDAGQTLVVDWRRDHPVLRSVGFDSLIVAKSRAAEVADDSPVTVLATGQHGPLLVEISDAQTRALICTFDVTNSSWPFDPGFVLFTAGSVIYLGNDAAAAGASLRPGDTLDARIPAAARNATLVLPDKSRVDLSPTADGRVAYGPLKSVGVYTLSWEGPALGSDIAVEGRVRRALAANLLDSYESQVGSVDRFPLASRLVQAQQEGVGAGLRKLWPYLLMAALAVMLIEWWVYNRKVMF